MSIITTITATEEATTLKAQYKEGCVCAFEVAIQLVDLDFLSSKGIDYMQELSFDTIFEGIQAWVKA